MVNRLAQEIHRWARSKGFYDKEENNPSIESEKLLLIVSEIAEAQSALRDGDRVHEAEEIADVFIRLLDYAAWREINLEEEVDRKMMINKGRPYLHGRSNF